MEIKQKTNYQEEIDNISKWMEEYNDQASTKGYVVGLSGGIDSAVVACLAVQAVGKENVIGVYLPCNSSVNMGDDAKLLAENLGISFSVINLFDSYNEIINRLKEAYKEEISNLTQANIKSRLRMVTLYSIANQKNMLVAGTSNLSEVCIGYFTKYGDGGVDIEPIGEYYKTEVYKIAELLKKIPDSIKTKAPSADLWSGQTDEQEIGMTYEELDEILYKINKRYTMSWEKGDKTDRVISLFEKSKHKNNLPPRYNRAY